MESITLGSLALMQLSFSFAFLAASKAGRRHWIESCLAPLKVIRNEVGRLADGTNPLVPGTMLKYSAAIESSFRIMILSPNSDAIDD
jgi:hypothetical protein